MSTTAESGEPVADVPLVSPLRLRLAPGPWAVRWARRRGEAHARPGEQDPDCFVSALHGGSGRRTRTGSTSGSVRSVKSVGEAHPNHRRRFLSGPSVMDPSSVPSSRRQDPRSFETCQCMFPQMRGETPPTHPSLCNN